MRKFKAESFEEATKYIEIITWLDHFSGDHSWTPLKHVAKEPPSSSCITVGFVVFENKDVVRMVGTFNDNKEILDCMTILKKAIIKREAIE